MQICDIPTREVKRKTIAEGKLLNQYLKIKKIGEGNYSKIKLMKNIQDGKFYAMKKYNLFILKKKNKLLKKQKDQPIYITAADEVYNQLRILKLVHHPNIAQLIEVLEDKVEEKVYLFLEYCENGEIAEWLPKKQKFILSPKLKEVKTFAHSILSIVNALEYLHSNNIVHRDIKPQNILIDKDLNVKIIDFGQAYKLENSAQKLRGSQGTYHFMAPETLSQVFKQGYDGKKCDLWSLGVTIYALIYETLPFYHQLLLKLFQQIEHGLNTDKLPEVRHKGFEIFVPIVINLMKLNPDERWSHQKLKAYLQKLF